MAVFFEEPGMNYRYCVKGELGTLIGHSNIQKLTPNNTPTWLTDSDIMDVRTDSCVAALKHQKHPKAVLKT